MQLLALLLGEAVMELLDLLGAERPEGGDLFLEVEFPEDAIFAEMDFALVVRGELADFVLGFFASEVLS